MYFRTLQNRYEIKYLFHLHNYSCCVLVLTSSDVAVANIILVVRTAHEGLTVCVCDRVSVRPWAAGVTKYCEPSK